MICLAAFCGGLTTHAAEPRRTLSKTLRPPDSVSGPGVTITYEAVVFDPAEPIPMIGNPKWDTSTPESTLKAVFLANRQANTNLIIQGFVPADREKIRNMIMQPDVLEKNTTLYARLAKVSLLQKLFYGDYLILTTSQEDTKGAQWRASYVFKMTPEGWLITNELAADRVYSQLVEMIAPKSPEKAK